MTKLRYLLATLILSFLAVPLMNVGAVSADAAQLECLYSGNEITFYTPEGCDLGIDKQVSVNGGAFTEAPTSSSAVTAEVGQTVTWKITVTDLSGSERQAQGGVTVTDVLPSQVSFVSDSASVGTFDSSTNVWSFNLNDNTTSNLPATLTLTTKANTLGLAENTVSFTTFSFPCQIDTPDENQCVDPAYADSNPDNNSAQAFVNIVAVPVTPAPTVNTPNTGFGAKDLSIWGTLALTSAGAAGLLATRKFASNK